MKFIRIILNNKYFQSNKVDVSLHFVLNSSSNEFQNTDYKYSTKLSLFYNPSLICIGQMTISHLRSLSLKELFFDVIIKINGKKIFMSFKK